jgi:hypothetical protein
MSRLPQDELVPVLQGIHAMLTFLAFRTGPDRTLNELLLRAAEVVNEAIESQI